MIELLKTYKREFATMFMAINMAFYAIAFYVGPTEHGMWMRDIANSLIWYSSGWVTAAFFADYLAKQAPWVDRKPPIDSE